MHLLRRKSPWGLSCVAILFIAACAINPTDSGQFDWVRWLQAQPRWPNALLLGEQHDAPEHQRLAQAAVTQLAARGQLAALVLEMAEQGSSSAGLARDASEAQTQTALQWQQAGWDWPTYAPVVMAAVRAGVPVLGGNLPRAQLRQAMQDPQRQASLLRSGGQRALEAQRSAVREGHCNLLPESQIEPMLRVQVARDQSLAGAVNEQVALQLALDAARRAAQSQAPLRDARGPPPSPIVLLLAGSHHVDTRWGLPLYLSGAPHAGDTAQAPGVITVQALSVQLAATEGQQAPATPQAQLRQRDGFDARIATAAPPAKDYCAGLRKPGAG